MTERRKKLIEVAFPLELINPEATRQKKKAPKGYPTSFHKWWAPRPLAICRAVLFAQLVDDPSSWPDRFPTDSDQKRERERLHKIIEAIAPWEASTNAYALNHARWEIARSVAWGLGEEPPAKSDADAVLAYLHDKGPSVYDPFCGGGSISLEAQRLGLCAHGSDLNPVAVLISKALVEIPPRFAGRAPVNPAHDLHRTWKRAEGLAEDVCYYGQWMREEAEKRIGHLYPKVTLEDGGEATVVAWLWARTVASPNPIAKGAHVPLVSSFMLSTRKDRKAWVEVVRDPSAPEGWRFDVRSGSISTDEEKAKSLGSKSGKAQDFICALTGTPIERRYIQEEGKADRLSQRLMAIVVDVGRRRGYISPTYEHQSIALSLDESPEVIEARETFLSGETPTRAMITGGVCSAYGLSTWGRLFTGRQLAGLMTITALVGKVRDCVLADTQKSWQVEDNRALCAGGCGPEAYADAIASYLALTIDRMIAYGSTLSTWLPKDSAIRSVFNRQALQMTWDFVEPNPFAKSSAGISTCVDVVTACINKVSTDASGIIQSANATEEIAGMPRNIVVSTDPPYYDNVGYADLSDYFYVWLRRSAREIWPDLFRRISTPKKEELVATAFHHGGQENAEVFFLSGMRMALSNIISLTNPDYPVTIYYAFKQSETAEEGLTSPGWATFLQAVFDAGFAVDGTWPVRSEGEVRMNSNSANTLASSIVLVCAERLPTAVIASRRDFIARLKREMPRALQRIREAGVGPVDMAQSSLGPGMGIFTSYAKVLEPDDSEMTVRAAIALINEVREEILGEEDAHYDTATRFCIDWFQTFGTGDGKSGDAINMANAYALGLGDLEHAGVFFAKGGVARLVCREGMPADWRPGKDRTLTHWECTQHLIRVLEAEDGGTAVAAGLVAEMSPDDAEAARALAYRLYDICEKKGWAQEAQAYNLLAEEFPHLEQAALDHRATSGPRQPQLDFGEAPS